MSAYDRWVGYMQRAIGQSDTESPTEQQREVAGPGHSVYSGLAGLLKVVSQNLPHTSAATSNSNGVAEDAQTGPQPAAPEKSTFMSMLMSWTSSAASPGSSYEQRLRDIRSRKLQLQDMVSQLETSERTILDKTIPAQAESSPSQNEASEFEDDAVMVGEASAHAAAAAAKAKVSDGKKPLYRRWLW
ncbi:hypothetical protein GGF46_003691 [Coemansia sp. RSA 552]|nr:hypothetical protein GGF46_003691 [Coemansia sp. RSA 552]